MNKFSFENARVNKVWDNKNRFNLGILDTRAVAQPDGSYQSVFVASRIVTTANPTISLSEISIPLSNV